MLSDYYDTASASYPKSDMPNVHPDHHHHRIIITIRIPIHCNRIVFITRMRIPIRTHHALGYSILQSSNTSQFLYHTCIPHIQMDCPSRFLLLHSLRRSPCIVFIACDCPSLSVIAITSPRGL